MSQNNGQTMARARTTQRRKTPLDKQTKILLIVFAVAGLLLAIVGGRFVFNLVKSWNLTSLPGAPVAGDNSNVAATQIPAEAPLQTNSGPEAVAWDGKSRVNILLLGLDYTTKRQAEDQGSPLSDTMILVSIDPMTKTIGVMSLRRDLWVPIPGFDYNKINTAYKLGEDYDLPGGGPQLAMDTVEQFLGVPIHYYAKVEFSAFTTLIDEIGGVKIKITQDMLLDWKGNGEKFVIGPDDCNSYGDCLLPGTYALAYARTRDAAYGEGDIARGNRQMEVITAIRDQILDVNNLGNLIARAPSIYQKVSQSVTTNMSLGQAIQLATLMASIPRANMTTYNITYDQAEPWTSFDGQYILRPIEDEIAKLRDQMFVTDQISAAENTAPTKSALYAGDPLTLALDEKARIEILNGTYTEGLADTTAVYLTSQGLNVVNTGNAENYAYTTIIYHNAKPYIGAYLSGLMQVPSSRILNQFDPGGAADITVYLGEDWATNNTMQP